MIRSDKSLVWRCCNTDWPANYRHCAWCGNGVLTVDRVVLRFPMVGGGDIAVVATRAVDAQSWGFLVKMIAASMDVFASPATETNAGLGAEQSDPAIAVDPSRSTPAAALTESVARPPQETNQP